MEQVIVLEHFGNKLQVGYMVGGGSLDLPIQLVVTKCPCRIVQLKSPQYNQHQVCLSLYMQSWKLRALVW